MKKIAAGATATVFAVAGLSAMSIAPASAAPFMDCPSAYNAGVANIPSTSDQYGSHLDSNKDGVGCENPPAGFVPAAQPDSVPPVAQPDVVTEPVDAASWAYDNCTDARAAGAVNIPAGTPGYGLHLDRDRDGFGCDADADADVVVDDDVVVDGSDHGTDEVFTGGDQVAEVPAGGADTGVPVEKSAMGSQQVGLSALALAAFTGSFLLLRRSVKA